MITETETDAGLLERFATLGEESAFAELVERHGPRVLRVCRRLLPNEQDAEEVYQATFLLLARKLGSVSWHESVDRWLCAVAHRLALNARAGVLRRQHRERPFASLVGGRFDRDGGALPERYHPLRDPYDEIHRRDMSRVLHVALDQLPEKYRVAVELCYLEGKSNEEAACQLGWPAGSMSRRLKRARSLLRHRLVRMGLTIAILAACTALAFTKIWRDGRPAGAPADSLRLAMQSFRSTSRDQVDLETMLQRMARSGQVVESREQLDELSRIAEWVAAQAAREVPDLRTQFWSTQAERMRLAALDLGDAARISDSLAVAEAARRLDATCIACHEVFRQ